MAFTPVPRSLGTKPATTAPLYLSLRYQINSSGKKWKNLGSVSGENGYLLPPPKTGLGMASQSTNLDEMSVYSVPSVSDVARSIAGDSLFYGVSSLLGTDEKEDLDYIQGGVTVPKNLQFLRFAGMKKRVYQFGIQLYAYDANDADDIASFVRTMHSLAAPRVSVSAGNPKLYAPAIFQPRIVTAGGGEAEGFLIDPKPCALLSFTSSAGKYTSILGGKPAIMTISIALAEIEPVVAEGNTIRQQFEFFSK